MTNKENFKWLINDIDSSLVLKVVYKKDNIYEEYGVFNVSNVLETPCDELEVSTGNINDLTNLLTLGVVRFTNIGDQRDVLEIPFRKLILLYKNANVLGENKEEKLISFGDLDTFSIIDGTIRNDLLVFSAVIDNPSDDLEQVMNISYEFSNYGMQEKMNALEKITIINHKRIINDEKERILK